MELKEKPTHFYSIFFAEKKTIESEKGYIYIIINKLQRKYFFPFKEIILF